MARVPVHRDLTNLRPRLVVDVAARAPRVKLTTSRPARTNRGTKKLPTCPLPPITTIRTGMT